MYVLADLTNIELTISIKDETGADIGTPAVYSLTDYKFNPNETGNFAVSHFIIRGINEPDGSWPPVAAYPKIITIFTNSATTAVQSENEYSGEA